MRKRKLMLLIICIVAILENRNLEAKVESSLKEEKICYECHGEGRQTCPVCAGSGLQFYGVLGIKSFPTLDELTIVCTRCNGSGKITCTVCGGTGTLQQ